VDYKSKLNTDFLPKHVAIIMDGNGRWAKQRGLLRSLGHERGTRAVRETVEGAAKIGIKNLTLYAFSTENWNRPKLEVQTLMKLLVSSLKKEINTLQDNNIKLSAIGNLDRLPGKVYKELSEAMNATANNNRMTLTLALSYGAREELVNAVKSISLKVKNNIISPDNIDDNLINEHIYTRNMPDVDLLIRTSGEQRISNFLLWQIAYAELYFTDILWPDFNEDELFKALYSYQKRERRFGKTSEQLS
jgi:undecaprenyl diphosphate synthase